MFDSLHLSCDVIECTARKYGEMIIVMRWYTILQRPS